METDEIYLRLVALTESPHSPLRQQPRSAWSAAQRDVVDVLDVIEHIDATYHEEADPRSAMLASLTSDDIARFDAALLAIGATRERVALGCGYRYLTRGAAQSDPAQRQADIAALLSEYPPLIYRLSSAIDTDELLQKAYEHLVRNGHGDLLQLPAHSATAGIDAAPVVASANDGRQSIFLLRHNRATRDLLDAWIRQRGGADYVREQRHRRVADFSAVLALPEERRSFHGPLANAMLGELIDATSSPATPFPALGKPLDAQWLAQTQRFHWALGATDVGKHSTLIWTSDDAELCTAFERQLDAVAEDCLVSGFRCADASQLSAHGLTFHEIKPFGMPALIAAEGDQELPWIIARYSAENRFWWHRASARLQSCAWIRVHHGKDQLFVAYRATDRDAFLELWRRLNRDDNIGFAAVSGRSDAHTLLERAAQTLLSTENDALRHLSGPHGWAYQHIWGGGSDEHMTLFFSTDAQITRRVADFAGIDSEVRGLRFW